MFSPKAEGISNNPCSPCHPFPNGAFDQYLDILESDSQTQIPSSLAKDEPTTVSVAIENTGNSGIYETISGVSLRLTSQYGFFSVNSETYSVGNMQLGKKTGIWQITGQLDGYDTILISVTGINQHGPSQFSESYTIPITVGTPTASPSPTPTPTPTPTPSPPPTPTTMPTPTPTISQLSVILQSPKEGANWSILTTHNIFWQTNGGKSPVRITLEYLTSNSNEAWVAIAKNIANNGSITWEIPNTNQTLNLRITAFDSNNPPQTSIAMANIQVSEPIPEFTTILMPTILIVGISLVIIFKQTTKQKKASNFIQ